MSLERINKIKELIEEEIGESTSINGACECDVRILNLKYNIKNSVNVIVKLLDKKENHECTCGNCTNEECSCKKSE